MLKPARTQLTSCVLLCVQEDSEMMASVVGREAVRCVTQNRKYQSITIDMRQNVSYYFFHPTTCGCF